MSWWTSCEGRLDELLAQAFTARVREIPEYGDSQVTVLEIRDTARETFRRLIHGLRGGPARTARDGLLAFASDLGSKRARAGIPPESLTSAVRLDFSILWADLLADRRTGGCRAAGLPGGPGLAGRRRIRHPHPHELPDRARAHGPGGVQHPAANSSPGCSTRARPRPRPPPGWLRPGHRAGCPLRPRGCQRRRRRPPSCGRYPVRRRPAPPEDLPARIRRKHLPVFWPLLSWPPRGGPEKRGTRRSCRRSWRIFPPAMSRRLHGLRGLPAAARTAESLAALLRPSDAGPLSADAAWARFAQQNLQDAGLDLAAQTGGRHGGMPRRGTGTSPGNGAALSSPPATSRPRRNSCFCHRNTILNRLNRFQELTGIDLTIPAQAARLVVAWA